MIGRAVLLLKGYNVTPLSTSDSKRCGTTFLLDKRPTLAPWHSLWIRR